MSDLQCAATLLLVSSVEKRLLDETSTPDEGQDLDVTGAIGRRLAGAHVALVYTGPSQESSQIAGVLGAAAGARVVSRDDLQEGSASSVLPELADLHRGETVLVVLPGHTIASALAPHLGLQAGLVQPAAASDVVEVAVDGDGWTLREPTTPD